MLEPARKAAGLSQEDVAEMSGVTRRTVGSAERGDKIPQASVLKKLMIAVDLYDDSLDAYSVSTRRWLATLGPLIESIPERPRNHVLGEVAVQLAAEVARYASRPSLTGLSQGDVVLAAHDDLPGENQREVVESYMDEA